ncbi:bifunctional 2-polyprenyl-6-hydroxyphenol methylase/3-demethylubiquinol 3-O-methyltransferase UbiG [Candidatus Neomarinimicrobiota bacterium]
MKNNLEIYNQMDWWDDSSTLLQQMPIKFNYFLKNIKILSGIKILDVGCGGGLLTEEFAKYGAIVTGVDISNNSINIARNHAKQNNLEIDYKVGRAEELPVTDMYDAVICTDCLEHVENLDKSISEVSRVLKPNGIFLYDTINRTILSRITVIWFADFVFRKQLEKIGVTEDNYTVHEWSKLIKPNELYTLFEKYKLKNIETKGLNFAGIKKGIIKTKIGNNTKIAYIGYAKKI